MRRRRRLRQLSMTSLIDVIFLLLLFFMLSSTFTRFAELELTAAASGARGASGPPPLFLQLRADEIRLNGEATSLSALPGALTTAAGQEDRTLLVSLGGAVSAQRLADLLVAVQPVRGVTPTIVGAR